MHYCSPEYHHLLIDKFKKLIGPYYYNEFINMSNHIYDWINEKVFQSFCNEYFITNAMLVLATVCGTSEIMDILVSFYEKNKPTYEDDFSIIMTVDEIYTDRGYYNEDTCEYEDDYITDYNFYGNIVDLVDLFDRVNNTNYAERIYILVNSI